MSQPPAGETAQPCASARRGLRPAAPMPPAKTALGLDHRHAQPARSAKRSALCSTGPRPAARSPRSQDASAWRSLPRTGSSSNDRFNPVARARRPVRSRGPQPQFASAIRAAPSAGCPHRANTNRGLRPRCAPLAATSTFNPCAPRRPRPRRRRQAPMFERGKAAGDIDRRRGPRAPQATRADAPAARLPPDPKAPRRAPIAPRRPPRSIPRVHACASDRGNGRRAQRPGHRPVQQMRHLGRAEPPGRTVRVTPSASLTCTRRR